MAQDDITTVLQNVSGGSTITRQPASGVEERLLFVGNAVWNGTQPYAGPSIDVNQIDASANSARVFIQSRPIVWRNMNVMFNNTNYFEIYQRGATNDLAYGMIEVG